MIVSRCCKKSIYIVHDYYVCEACSLACDTMILNHRQGETYHDARNDNEIKEVARIA